MKTYKLNGVEGVLLNTENEQLKGLKPLRETGDAGFYSLEQIRGIEIDEEDSELSYTDSYCGYTDCEEIDVFKVSNLENGQKIIEVFENVSDANADLYKRMLLTETTHYHDWASDLSTILRRIRENKENPVALEEIKKEWAETIEEYETCDCLEDPMNFEELLKRVEE